MSGQRTPRTAVYAGTFDPITNGHVDIISRAVKVFDQVYVGVAESTPKEVLFPLDVRVDMVLGAIADFPKEFRECIKVQAFKGLLVDYARGIEAVAIIRGLRAVSDYEYESQMAHINRKLAEEIETVFLVTSDHCSFISSSVVKEIARNKGDITMLVPPNVVDCFNGLR